MAIGTTAAVLGGIGLAGAAASGIGGAVAAGEQSKASEKALAMQAEAARNAQNLQMRAGYDSDELIARAGTQGQEALIGGQNQALTELLASRGDLRAGLNQAAGSLGGAAGSLMAGQAGQEQALDVFGRQAGAELAIAGTRASNTLDPVIGMQRYANDATQAVGTRDVTGQNSMLAGLVGSDPFANFQQDPGFAFRQQQGEQAINRAASARGGRLSGRTLKELSQFNQGLASQEYGNFAQRQLAARGQSMGAAGQVDALRQQSLQNQAGRELQSSLAAQGNQAGLAQAGLSASGQLAGIQAGIGGQQANVSMARGQQLGASRAALGAQLGGLGQQMAGFQMGTGQGLAGIGGQMSSLAMQGGQNLASMLTGTAAQRSNALMGAAGASGNITQSMLPAYQGPTQYAGAGTAAITNAVTGGLNNLAMLGLSGGFGGNTGVTGGNLTGVSNIPGMPAGVNIPT